MSSPSTELKIDIDGRHTLPRWFVPRLRELISLQSWQPRKRVKVSTVKTTHGMHVRVKFPPYTLIRNREIILWQLLLGSDTNREFFNYKRVVRTFPASKNWNVLFSEKRSGGKVVSHEYPETAKTFEVIV